MSALGDIIRERREGRGWSQEALARQAGLRAESVRKLEDEDQLPTNPTLEQIHDALGGSFSEMLMAARELEPLVDGFGSMYGSRGFHVDFTPETETLDPDGLRPLRAWLAKMFTEKGDEGGEAR